jgi:hypothetical protein
MARVFLFAASFAGALALAAVRWLPRLERTVARHRFDWLGALLTTGAVALVTVAIIDGPGVLTWLDLHTSVAPPAPTANSTHVEHGRITAIRVTFDARRFAPPDGD